MKCPHCGRPKELKVPKDIVLTKEDWIDLYYTLRDFKRRLLLRHGVIVKNEKVN